MINIYVKGIHIHAHQQVHIKHRHRVRAYDEYLCLVHTYVYTPIQAQRPIDIYYIYVGVITTEIHYQLYSIAS